MNTNTNKIVESVNEKVDEYSKLNEVEHKEEPENYRTFIYYYECTPEEDIEIQVVEQVSITFELHTLNVESH